MPTVVRLKTEAERERRSGAAELAEQLVLFAESGRTRDGEALSQPVRDLFSRAARAAHRLSRDPDEGLWPAGEFVMLGPKTTARVWKELRDLPASDRPVLVRDAFMLLLCNLDFDTGHVDLTRKQLAAELGVRPNQVTDAMRVLEREGIVQRVRERVEGAPGAPSVTYRVNPAIAFKGGRDARKRVAEDFRQHSLQLVPGGKDGEGN